MNAEDGPVSAGAAGTYQAGCRPARDAPVAVLAISRPQTVLEIQEFRYPIRIISWSGVDWMEASWKTCSLSWLARKNSTRSGE
jgi:hypothetical protein